MAVFGISCALCFGTAACGKEGENGSADAGMTTAKTAEEHPNPEIIIADPYDVTIMSRNTGHYWYLHNPEYPTESSVVCYHKHRYQQPFHMHYQIPHNNFSLSIDKIYYILYACDYNDIIEFCNHLLFTLLLLHELSIQMLNTKNCRIVPTVFSILCRGKTGRMIYSVNNAVE
ncbi:MAG: hypothetical protein J6O73_13130 [Lachnospiraceae bacterium]|nr:hypothetical protein [Lachnospiraceae bacterium]